MPRDLILGTAGHIDHGKTALVKALTGIDCDRLPEEKKRGITIDIGFATLDLGDFRLGIVDVPGHERFIKNMLAGATGFDLALLVVAADDSVMPQTREHLEILRLLGLSHGLIALTKADLVDATSLEVAELEIRELVEGSFLEKAPLVPTSVETGAGIPELKQAIAEACRQVADRNGSEYFRLAIDRAFVVQGHGTVVTGSATSGSVSVGEELEWQPLGRRVRVRSLQNHGQLVARVHRGQRVAINLAGVRHDQIERGQELATPGYLAPARVMTARLHCLADVNQPLKHRQRVRVHLGTAEIMGTISLLDCDAVQPGGWGLGQLFLEKPALATWGQPFVLRVSTASYTLGGGQVLQPLAHKVRRRHIESIERIGCLWSQDVAARISAAAWLAGPDGIRADDLVRATGATPEEVPVLLEALRTRGDLVKAGTAEPGGVASLIHGNLLTTLETRILEALRRLHERFPLVSTHDRQKLHNELAGLTSGQLFDRALQRLVDQRRLIGDQHRVACSDFEPKLSAPLRKLKEKLIAAYKSAGLKTAKPHIVAEQFGANVDVVENLIALCVQEGVLVQLQEDIFLHREVESEVRGRVIDKLAGTTGMTMAQMRDFLGSGRQHAIAICEYLDRIGLTRRDGDVRTLASNTMA